VPLRQFEKIGETEVLAPPHFRLNSNL
jgi:hypothetical protein